MNMTNEPLTTPEEKSSKATLFFMTLALAALMVSAVVGGAAFMIYRQFSTMPDGTSVTTTHTPQTTRLSRSSDTLRQSQPATAAPMNRPVVADSSDRSDYRYADNTVLPPAAARRVIAAWRSNPVVSNVPPPLVKTSEETAQEVASRPPTSSELTADRPNLSDPESRYIVNPLTGRIIGVDGSVGAAAEARRQPAVPVAVAVQTPPLEVRVASPVQVRAAIPVNPGDEYSSYQQVSTDSQYVPVRRAQPATGRRPFDAASYLAVEDNRPVLRGQTVINPTSRAAGYRHDFRLPDQGSRY